MEKKKFNIINLIVIIFGLFLIFLAVYLVYIESNRAKVFCDSLNESYVLNIFALAHTCNGEVIKEYSYGWDFENNIESYRLNLSLLDRTP